MRGVRSDASHREMAEVADQSKGAGPGERQRVADQQPCHGDEWNRDEAHHDDVQHAGGADHAAVENGQPGRHEQDERCAGQQPGGGGRIDRLQRSSFDVGQVNRFSQLLVKLNPYASTPRA